LFLLSLDYSIFSINLQNFQFTPPVAHEYVKVTNGVGTVGITDFAQSALGDIVFVDLPEVGDEFEKGESFGSVESVKAASDVYAPVSGKILEINENISDDPSLVNADPEGEAWFIKIQLSDPKDLVALMDAAAYKAHCDKEAH
jgi:glycine cleavage system H protein